MKLINKIKIECDYISLGLNWVNYRKLNLDDRDDKFNQDIISLVDLLPEYQFVGKFNKTAIFVLNPPINDV